MGLTESSTTVNTSNEPFIDYSHSTCMYMYTACKCEKSAWKISWKNSHSRTDSSRTTHAQHFLRICGKMTFGRVSMAGQRSQRRE